MKLHQLKIEFNPEHDRMLLRVLSDDGKEVLAWLTRRCVKLLWPTLLKVAQGSPEIARQADPETKTALLGFEHEKAIRQADFSKPYQETAKERPLGADPLLVSRIQTRRNERGGCTVSLLPSAGPGIHLTLEDQVLHSFCRLLQTAAAKSDWNIDLALPQAVAPGEPGGKVRTLN
jgi:hypothetical protein